jgi:hypothetical protein
VKSFLIQLVFLYLTIMNFSQSLFILVLFAMLSSCIVNAPRYTTVEKVFTLKLGLTKDEVAKVLETPAYNLKSMTDSETVLLYKYRVKDRTTLPFMLKPNNGKRIDSKFVNLVITYNKQGVSKSIMSCGDCDETIVETKRLDINKLFTLLTVTIPVVLVYFGIKLGLSR